MTYRLIEIGSPATKRTALADAQRRCQAAIDADRQAGLAYERAYRAFEVDRREHYETQFHAAREHYAAALQRLAAARVYMRATQAAIAEPASPQRQEARRQAHEALAALEPTEQAQPASRRRWRRSSHA